MRPERTLEWPAASLRTQLISGRNLRARFAREKDLGLSKADFAVLRRLSTPQKIQDFLNAMSPNFETDGQTCLSVREVLRQRRAHCIEGAMLAACALWVHGKPPLLLDLRAERDYDHVVALFRRGGTLRQRGRSRARRAGRAAAAACREPTARRPRASRLRCNARAAAEAPRAPKGRSGRPSRNSETSH